MYFIYLINTRNTEHVKIIVTYRNDSEQGKDDAVVYPGILLGGGGFKQFHQRPEEREKGNLGGAPLWFGVLETAVIGEKKFHFI